MTVTHSMSGMPAIPNIPPDVLAKMPPEQRARVEAAMKGGPSTDVRKECITKEKLEKQLCVQQQPRGLYPHRREFHGQQAGSENSL